MAYVRKSDRNKQEDQPVLIPMVRDERYTEPRTADVHPDEVETWKKYDWIVAEEQK